MINTAEIFTYTVERKMMRNITYIELTDKVQALLLRK